MLYGSQEEALAAYALNSRDKLVLQFRFFAASTIEDECIFSIFALLKASLMIIKKKKVSKRFESGKPLLPGASFKSVLFGCTDAQYLPVAMQHGL